MIAICQPFAGGTAQAHLSFDADMIRAFCLAFPREDFVFMADSVALARMARYLGSMPNNLSLRTVGSSCQGLRRLRLRGGLLRNLVACRREAEAAQARLLVYLAFNSDTAALHLLRETPLTELYFVHNNYQRALASRIERKAFHLIAQRANLIFLEETIAARAQRDFQVDEQRVFVIPFPIPQLVSPSFKKSNTIVMAGSLTAAKGLKLLHDAIQLVSQELVETKAAPPINIVGPYHSGRHPSTISSHVQYSEQQLTDSELNRVVASAKFLLLLHDPSCYEYVTPGTFYRAIGCRTPVISTDLPVLEEFFHSGQPTGISVRSPTELAETLVRLDTLSESEYRAFLDSIDAWIARRSIEATATQIREVFAQ